MVALYFKVKYKMVALSPWKPWPFKLEVQKNTCLAPILVGGGGGQVNQWIDVAVQFWPLNWYPKI